MSPAVELRWQDHARCVGADLDLFFPESNDKHAKAFCAGCPVWAECLAYGLYEDHGVWGGLNSVERGRLRRLRNRLARQPDDSDNARDARLLVSAGLAPERLSGLLDCPVETVVALSAVPRRRRNVA